MTNPFQTPSKEPKYSSSEQSLSKSDGTPTREVIPSESPTLICKICKKPIQRAHHGDNRWVHIDDEVTLNDLAKGLLSSLYNHDPLPNYIETTAKESSA
jgi:hypothetical protein